MTDRDVSPASGAPGPTVVFDVTETLLDLSVLSPVFVRIFGTADTEDGGMGDSRRH